MDVFESPRSFLDSRIGYCAKPMGQKDWQPMLFNLQPNYDYNNGRRWRIAGSYFLTLSMAWQASLTALPSSRVESLKMSSPSRLNTAILLWRCRYPFPPSWSRVNIKSALARLFVTISSGQRRFRVLMISAV